MSTLTTLTVFPVEEGGNFSEDFINLINNISDNLDILNEEKAEIATENTFTEENTFTKNTVLNGGFQTGKTSVTADHTITSDEGFLTVITSTVDISLELPQAQTVIGKEILICLRTDGGYDAVIDCYPSDTLNAAGNNRVTLDDADDFIELKALDTGRWLIKNNTGTLATV